MTDPDLIDVQELAPAEVAEVDLYQRREKIYTRKIEGFFQRLRLFTGWLLLIGYFVVPWLSWNERQLVLFNLPQKRIVQVHNTYAEVQREDRGRIRKAGRPTGVYYHYQLPAEWAIVP